MSIITKLIKKNGKLVYYQNADLTRFASFASELKEGEVIENYSEVVGDDKTLPQLAKVHAMIRVLATHTGTSFSQMKLLIKKESGLCHITKMGEEPCLFCESFSDCSKEEVALAIQECIVVGEKVGLILH